MKKSFTINDSLKIKGVAILLMIFHHLFRLTEFTNEYDISFYPFTSGRIAQVATFFKICVPIFVFLSGYGLLSSYKNMKSKESFFIKRYFKLMPTFWFTMIISFVLLEVFTGAVSKHYFSNNLYYGVTDIIFDFLGINGLIGKGCFSGNWWYIGASLIFIFLLPVIYKFSKKYGWFNVGVAIVIIPRIFNITNVSTTSALPYVFSFYLGMLFQEFDGFNKIKKMKINYLVKFCFYLLTLLVLYLMYTHFPRNIFWEFHFGLVPLVFICFCYEFIISIPIINKILSKLGEYSYVMFLIHGFFISYTNAFIYSFTHIIFSFLALTIISFAIAVLLKFLMKISRFDCLCKNIKKSISS